MESFEPVKVTITVVSGRNLHGKKKGDVCHASVVFGFGKEMFQTEEIQSNEPFWNQEAHVKVNGKVNDSLTFKLKNQGHTVGIITLPISSLTRRKHEQWLPLKPYKKEKEPQGGELCLNCYVSEHRPLPPAAVGSELSPSISHGSSSSEDISPGFKKSLFHRGSPMGGRPNLSDSDLRRDNLLSPPTDKIREESSHSRDSSVEKEEEITNTPEVSGISPSQGTTEGNQRVILRGNNLGESRADIIRITLVDVDCTNTLEYFSCGKLAITALPRSEPGSGPVIVETYSGGVSVSSLHYSYVLSSSNKQEVENSQRKIKGTTPNDQEMLKLQNENKTLKQQIKELKEKVAELNEENTTLNSYVEKLLATIMEHQPELLDIARSHN